MYCSIIDYILNNFEGSDNKNETDGENIGIHQFAHALYSEISNDGRHERRKLFLELNELSINRQLNSENSFLTKRALENKFDFFSVACEYFFERNKEFRGNDPILFELISEILNQKPLSPITLWKY